MTREQLNIFWSHRLIKTWVVNLLDRRGGKRETLIVRSKTMEGAIRTAKANSFVVGAKAHGAQARYAHPVTDLKCTPSTGEFARPRIGELSESGIKHYYPHLTNLEVK